jgi:hypothetical protein
MGKKKSDEFRDEQEDFEQAALGRERMMADSEADYIEMSEKRIVGKNERESMARTNVKYEVARYHHMRTEKEYTGQINGGGGVDKFRMKIWGNNGILYDNQLNAPDTDDPATVIGGGSIVIHTK